MCSSLIALVCAGLPVCIHPNIHSPLAYIYYFCRLARGTYLLTNTIIERTMAQRNGDPNFRFGY